jgi:hypothetical protein
MPSLMRTGFSAASGGYQLLTPTIGTGELPAKPNTTPEIVKQKRGAKKKAWRARFVRGTLAGRVMVDCCEKRVVRCSKFISPDKQCDT